jgi:hypothetical protein
VIFFANEGDNFLQDVWLVLEVAGDTPTWTDVAVVPALRVDRIYTEELKGSVVEFVVNSVDHFAIFKLKETTAGGWEDECRKAGVAEDEHLHLATQ